MAIGLIVALPLHYFHPYLVQELDEIAMDWMIAASQGHVPKSHIPFIFLDIDERSYQEWQEPVFTPRDKLLTLIQFAVDSQAQIVIVDIDLTRRADLNAPAAPLSKADQALFNYLSNYSTTCKPVTLANHQRCPQLILARPLKQVLDPPNDYLQQRSSFLDPALKQSKDVHWASARFYLDRYYIRHWQLWETLRNDQGKETFMSSVQLLAAKLIRNPTKTPVEVTACLQNELYWNANTQDQAHSKNSDCQGQDNLNIEPHPTHLQQRIFYKLRWKLRKGESRPHICLDSQEHVACATDQTRPLLEIISANSIIQAAAASQHSEPEQIKGSIVVIGGSFEDSRDLYDTPIGTMPGALILLNSIHSLLDKGGDIKPPTYCKTILIEFALIIVIALFFLVFGPFRGIVISFLFIFFVLLPISFGYFQTGVWVGLAIPLVAVILHHLYERLMHKHHE
jgi:CHASE2 domain-containing sensor protein